MSRRTRSHGSISDLSQGSSARISPPRYAERAQTPPVSYWSSLLDESLGSPPAVRQLPRFVLEPLPFIPSSLPRGQIPRLISPARPPVGGGRAYSRLLAGLQRAQALPYGSTPCQRRRTRSRVLHALGIAGRKGVGAGKPRRLSLTSHVRCR
jgi:hypothetical protein